MVLGAAEMTPVVPPMMAPSPLVPDLTIPDLAPPYETGAAMDAAVPPQAKQGKRPYLEKPGP